MAPAMKMAASRQKILCSAVGNCHGTCNLDAVTDGKGKPSLQSILSGNEALQSEVLVCCQLRLQVYTGFGLSYNRRGNARIR
jgi:hypothetical protein